MLNEFSSLPLTTIIRTIKLDEIICCYDKLLSAETGWTPGECKGRFSGMLGWCMGWKRGNLFEESPVCKGIRAGTFVDSYYCVAGDACLELAVDKGIPILGLDGRGRRLLEGC
jgi:hypothetical protein